MEIALAVLIVGLIVLLSVWASMKVIADEFSERRQKGAQLALVWLVPVIGALLVLAVHRKAEEASGRYRNDPDPGDDYGQSGRVKRIVDALDDD